LNKIINKYFAFHPLRIQNFKVFNDTLLMSIISLMIILYISRTVIPFLKYPFIIIYSIIILYTFISLKKNKKNLLNFTKEFIKENYILLLILVILLYSFFISSKFFLLAFKDIFNSFILISFVLLIKFFIDTKGKLNILLNSFICYIILMAIILSCILLVNMLNINVPENEYILHNEFKYNLNFPPLSDDYNFISLFLFLGIFGLLYYLAKIKSKIIVVIISLLITFISINIIISGSKRALFIIFLLFLIETVIMIFALIFKKRIIQILVNKLIYLFSFFVVILFFSLYFIFALNYNSKEKVLKYLGSNNIILTKQKLSYVLYRYTTIVSDKYSYRKVYDILWNSNYDTSLNPDCGWGTNKHKTIFPVFGLNNQIVPNESRAYYIDSTSIPKSFNGFTYSFTEIGNPFTHNDDKLVVSVYCYVSPDFNGHSAGIITNPYQLNSSKIAKYEISDSTIGEISTNTKAHSSISENNYLINSYLVDSANSDNYNKQNNKYNLFSNSKFQEGKRYWIPFDLATKHDLINTPFGNGIRVSRGKGDGGSFSLVYSGRPIIYYLDHEYVLKFKYKVIKGDQDSFKVGWYVDHDGNGFELKGTIIKNNINHGWKELTCKYKFKKTCFNTLSFLSSLKDSTIIDITDIELMDMNLDYNKPVFIDQLNIHEIKHKGYWKKIELSVNCSEGYTPVFLFFAKKYVYDFSSLTGYVMFSYPKITIIKKNGYDTINYKLGLNDLNIQKCYENVERTETPDVLPIFNFQNIIYSENTYDNKVINSYQSLEAKKYSELSFFSSSNFISTVKVDIVKDWINKFNNEDTTYFPYRAAITVDTISRFLDDRLVRWKFAMQLFIKEYTVSQKILGGGFNHLNWYGYLFLKDKTQSDYPHNPFLSILLYSGIFGLILYLLLLFKVFYYYIKYIKTYYLFFIFFLITFFFTFFSGGSPFDPPIMGFFILLPFLIHSIHKSDVKSINTI